MRFEHLFSPFTINGMTLKNRAVMPPMATGYGNADNTVSERLLAYWSAGHRADWVYFNRVCAV
jgi:2,4-dienoyl-CoA reductase-like NADH-dependent reductase (Old Yellow Enzyme family)